MNWKTNKQQQQKYPKHLKYCWFVYMKKHKSLLNNLLSHFLSVLLSSSPLHNVAICSASLATTTAKRIWALYGKYGHGTARVVVGFLPE